MKLISFAIVSLLAIAVSAHPPPNTSAGDDTPQYTQENIDAELAQLKADYENRKTMSGVLLVQLEEAEDVKGKYRSEKDYTKKLLKSVGFDGDRRQKLEVALKRASKDWKKASGIVLDKQQQLEYAKELLGMAKAEVLILTENQRQIEEHNADNTQDLMTVSAGCYYNKEILNQQVKEACEEAEGASGSSQSIDDGSSKLDEVIERVGDPKNTPNREFRAYLDKPPRELEVAKVSMQFYCDYLTGLRNSLGE
ncbi:hypothetical protein BASA83_006948 [Batrachochytrium salamandrivorans]|nr:hypothetical protein BASA83_006948 [Batrachochytrium salamandrivorans]